MRLAERSGRLNGSGHIQLSRTRVWPSAASGERQEVGLGLKQHLRKRLARGSQESRSRRSRRQSREKNASAIVRTDFSCAATHFIASILRPGLFGCATGEPGGSCAQVGERNKRVAKKCVRRRHASSTQTRDPGQSSYSSSISPPPVPSRSLK